MGERRGTKALELWCKRVTQGYDGVSIENMSTSWKNGLAFCALIHHFRPDLIDYDGLDKNDIYGNNELAFRIAENHLGIPALLDPEDMACVEIPDRLSILTYLSQFYQTFSSQATTPVKTSPESPTAVERPRTNPGSGQNPPTKLGAGVGGCRVCDQSVFLAQRLLISGHLFHRTCFKCARCGALLSVANYYETQDGKYCCETCPDEERLAAAVAATADEQPPAADGELQPRPVSLRRAPSSLVGDRRALFETLAAADCTDDVKASKKNATTTRRPSVAAAVAATDAACGDDNDSGVVVVGDGDKKDDDGGTPPDDDEDAAASAGETLADATAAPVADGPVGPTRENPPPSTAAVPPDRRDDPAPLSDDLKRVLNATAEGPPQPADRDYSPDDGDPEIRTLANKLLKMDYYESNNNHNKEVPVPSPRKKIKSPIAIAVDEYPESLNPFDDEDDGKGERRGDSTNPFGSDSDEETESPPPPLPPPAAAIGTRSGVGSNPFSSDEDESETSTQLPPPPRPRTMLSPMLKPRHQTHRKQSSASSISSFSTTPRKKKPAPPPPKTRQSFGSIEYTNNIQISSPNSLEDSSCSGSEPSSSVTNNEERYRLHKSTHGKWKRKKGPAPQCPIPQRRRIKPMPIEDIKQELLDIEIKQQELERQGVKLEKDIRLKCNEDLNNVDVEEMVLQLFELVNEKNELFRKHAELMYLRRQHNLEEEHAELEYQIRVLMARPDHTKTDSEKAREEELIQRLVEVVGRRNEIVENLEKDRLREAEEDRSVFNQIGTFAQDETLPCVKPVDVVTDSKKNFSKRLLKNIKKVKSKKEKPEDSSPSKSPSNSSYSKGTLKKFMTLGHSSRKYLRPKSS